MKWVTLEQWRELNKQPVCQTFDIPRHIPMTDERWKELEGKGDNVTEDEFWEMMNEIDSWDYRDELFMPI
jgi:hypothetical protein